MMLTYCRKILKVLTFFAYYAIVIVYTPIFDGKKEARMYIS